MLRVKVDRNGVIESVQISGDFFLHPEEAIKELEGLLSGINAGMEEAAISSLLEEAIKSKSIEMIGISASDVARVLKKAIENAKTVGN